uniref:Uncharacterized protein n=1 Tax=Rhizophora mucronata TaxID=61149 RepID=A0A2P2N6J6_RHIMU
MSADETEADKEAVLLTSNA